MDRVLRIEQKVSPIHPSNDSLLLALPAWDYELRDRCDSPRQIASETTAILLAGPLEAGVKDTVILGSGKARPDRSPPSMVVGSGVYQSWDDSGRSRSASDSVHGCVGFGLGSPCEPISGKWGMVSEGGHSSHKCVRNVSRPQLSNSISDSTGRPNGTVDVRQCDRSVVSLETRRHSFDEPVQSGERSASLSWNCTKSQYMRSVPYLHLLVRSAASLRKLSCSRAHGVHAAHFRISISVTCVPFSMTFL